METSATDEALGVQQAVPRAADVCVNLCVLMDAVRDGDSEYIRISNSVEQDINKLNTNSKISRFSPLMNIKSSVYKRSLMLWAHRVIRRNSSDNTNNFKKQSRSRSFKQNAPLSRYVEIKTGNLKEVYILHLVTV